MAVVFFRRPVVRPANEVPLILPTVIAKPEFVTSPVKVGMLPEPRTPVMLAAVPVVLWLRVGKSEAMAIENTPVEVVFLIMPVPSEPMN